MSEPDGQPTVKCPSCGEEMCLEALASVPASQKTSMRLTSESELIAAEVIGNVIAQQCKVFQAVAKQMGTRVAVFVSNMTCTPGVVEIEFIITSVK